VPRIISDKLLILFLTMACGKNLHRDKTNNCATSWKIVYRCTYVYVLYMKICRIFMIYYIAWEI